MDNDTVNVATLTKYNLHKRDEAETNILSLTRINAAVQIQMMVDWKNAAFSDSSFKNRRKRTISNKNSDKFKR